MKPTENPSEQPKLASAPSGAGERIAGAQADVTGDISRTVAATEKTLNTGAVITPLGEQDTKGRDLYEVRTTTGKKLILGHTMYVRLEQPGESAMGNPIPAGEYQLLFLPTESGTRTATLKPMSAGDKGENYSVNFAKTTLRSIRDSDVKDRQATGWKKVPSPPPVPTRYPRHPKMKAPPPPPARRKN